MWFITIIIMWMTAMERDEYECFPDSMGLCKDIMTKIHPQWFHTMRKCFPVLYLVREMIAIDPDLSKATNGFKIKLVRLKSSFETAVSHPSLSYRQSSASSSFISHCQDGSAALSACRSTAFTLSPRSSSANVVLLSGFSWYPTVIPTHPSWMC